MGLVTKNEVRDAKADQPSAPIDWDAEVSADTNRDLFERLALEGYTADQIARVSVAEAKAILGDDIATLVELNGDTIDPAASRPSDRDNPGRQTAEEAALDAIAEVVKEGEKAAKSAESTAKAKSDK